MKQTQTPRIHFYTPEERYENRRREQKLYEAALDAQREREAAADEEAPRVEGNGGHAA